ncbi:MAG: flagellar hook capping protein [Lachnospiraceae bacterium]|nr:flagellar hook capping protein [Lachnospiraceae bacterium]
MSVGAIVKDGKLVESTAQTAQAAAKDAKATGPKGYDKDAFMQILVAQMKYQDPLEPTSNTEYINQYATFSQVEQLQNMASSMDLGRASGYVGQTVQIDASEKGKEQKIVEGVVDYVKYESGKAYLSVGGELYPADSVIAVIDSSYNDAVTLANAFANTVNKLPDLSEINLSHKDAIEALATGYDALTPYQKSMIDSSYVDKLKEYVDKITQMLEDSKKSEETAENTKESEKSDDVNNVEEKEAEDDTKNPLTT